MERLIVDITKQFGTEPRAIYPDSERKLISTSTDNKEHADA